MSTSETLVPLEQVVIKFAGDSGDGMQLTGTQFTNTAALFGNDLGTFPDFPAEIRAPQGTTAGVSGYQLHFGSTEIYTPGDMCDVLVVMNAAALKMNLKQLKRGGIIIANIAGFDIKNLRLAGVESNQLEDNSLDGYEVYNGLAAAHSVIHLGCWAHARRYFVEAEAAIPKPARGPEQLATRFIAVIGRLYAIEALAKEVNAEQRLQVRQTQSRAVLADIESLLSKHLHSVLPGSLLGKALHYLSAQWPKLIRFVENGRWPVDNNACENAIRPFVIGRRNWLFSDTVGGAQASANLYSLIETCKANRVEPYGYLMAVFRQLPLAKTADDFEALLPWKLTSSDLGG